MVGELGGWRVASTNGGMPVDILRLVAPHVVRTYVSLGRERGDGFIGPVGGLAGLLGRDLR